MAGNQQSWGSFLGGVAQKTIIAGAVVVGLLVGADILAHSVDAYNVANNVVGATDWSKALSDAVKGVLGFGGFDKTAIGSTLVSWAGSVNSAIETSINYLAARPYAATATAGVAGGLVAGSWTQKVMDQRAARAQGVEIA